MNNKRVKKWMNYLKAWGKALGQVALPSAYTTCFLYFSNFDEISFLEFLKTAIVMIIIGGICFFVTEMVLQNSAYSSLVATVVMLCFTNFIYVEKLFKLLNSSSKIWHVLGVIIYIWCLMLILMKNMKGKWIKDVNFVLVIVFSGLILMSIVSNVQVIFSSLFSNNGEEIHETNYVEDSQNMREKRDVYYLVFDEYSNNYFMQKYYSYDNSAFTDWLESEGFSVSYSSKCDYPSTNIAMTNNVNLDYVITHEEYSEEKSKNLRENALVFDIFENQGYETIVVGQSEFYGRGNPSSISRKLGAGSGGVTASGFNFYETVFNMTPFYPMITSSNLNSRRNEVIAYIDYMKSEEIAVNDNNIFCLFHVELPHASFIFDENGGTVSGAHYENWDDPQYYLNQYIYTTKVMKEIVSNIKENNPEAVILLTSDHAARWRKDFEQEDKRSHFLALYDSVSDSQDIEGKTTINVLRDIVNKLFDMDLEPIELPE